MQTIISSLLIVATITAVLITPLLYYHKQTIACWTTFIAVVLFAFAGCLQWQKHIWEVQAQAADHAEQANWVSKTLPTDRPELYISGAMMMPLEAGQPETVLLGLKNRGKAIARNIRLGGGNHVFTTRDFAGPLVYKPVPVQSRPDLGPDKEENSLISKSPQPLSQKQIEELENEEVLFFHFAEGEYDDDAGNTYPIDYCYMFNPLSPTILKMCPEKYWPKSRADRQGTPSLDAAPKATAEIKPPAPITRPKFGSTPSSKSMSDFGSADGSARSHPTPYDHIKWTDYTEDEFYDVIWRWHYKPPSNTPRDIKPYCPECQYPVELDYRLIFPQRSQIYTEDVVHLKLRCRYHPEVYRAEHIPNMQLDDFSQIKALIEGKLSDDSWREVVIAQKEARDGKGN